MFKNGYDLSYHEVLKLAGTHTVREVSKYGPEVTPYLESSRSVRNE